MKHEKQLRAGMVGFLEQIARVSETATCVIFNTVTIERTSFARYPFIYGTFVPTDVMTGLRHVFTGSGQTGYPANRFSMDFGRKTDGRCAMRDAGLCRLRVPPHCENKVADIFLSGADPEELRAQGRG